jgi:UDP-N-acetylmuramoyl-L-alanyl-D-glutamate--2,6-diaminopimelate ligase
LHNAPTLISLIEAMRPLLLSGAELDPASSAAKLPVLRIAYDSRAVRAGDIFFCLPGAHHNGEQFADQAIAKGAVAVVSENPLLRTTVPALQVADVRQAIAFASHLFFGAPSEKLRLIGVTGTNGKTTTTHLVRHILQKAGKSSGVVGTLGAHWCSSDRKEQFQELGHTTPQAPEVQEILARMLLDGVSHVAMEVSSHALALKRVEYCAFSTACLTNITQDHLDFHLTMDNYWRSKLLLFEKLSESAHHPRSAVINLDDPLAEQFFSVLGPDTQVLTYSWSKQADATVANAKFDFGGCQLLIDTKFGKCALQLKLNGPFNVYNAMAALLIGFAEGVDLETCKAALEEFTGVPGRFEIVNSKSVPRGSGLASEEEPLCIVDYAHTPDGLQNILTAARALVPPQGKLISVFGCGGDRDASKRPQMGKIAQQLSDQIIVTSDNPRSEDPNKIIDQILAGIEDRPTTSVEPDRARAIENAITLGTDKDVIVVAGKGHENYQILADRTIAFDDREHVREALIRKCQGANRK